MAEEPPREQVDDVRTAWEIEGATPREMTIATVGQQAGLCVHRAHRSGLTRLKQQRWRRGPHCSLAERMATAMHDASAFFRSLFHRRVRSNARWTVSMRRITSSSPVNDSTIVATHRHRPHYSGPDKLLPYRLVVRHILNTIDLVPLTLALDRRTRGGQVSL